MEDFNQLKKEFGKYKPPTDLWNKIETDLEYEYYIKPKLSTLPTYEVPEGIWNNITSDLSPTKNFIFRHIHIWKPTVAAILLISFGFGLGQWFHDKKETSTFSVTSNSQLQNESLEDQEDIENLKNQYVKFCKFYPGDNPCILINDLSDLESAEMELERIITQMGNSHTITRQLRRIELEKSKIIRNMAQQI